MMNALCTPADFEKVTWNFSSSVFLFLLQFSVLISSPSAYFLFPHPVIVMHIQMVDQTPFELLLSSFINISHIISCFDTDTLAKSAQVGNAGDQYLL